MAFKLDTDKQRTRFFKVLTDAIIADRRQHGRAGRGQTDVEAMAMVLATTFLAQRRNYSSRDVEALANALLDAAQEWLNRN